MRKTSILAAIAATLTASAATARAGDIRFYSGNFCKGGSFFLDSEHASTTDCKNDNVCPNDWTRSIWIADGVRAGTIVKVWDSPDGSGKDDWAQIVVRNMDPAAMGRYRHNGGLCIDSYQQNVSGPAFAVTYRRHNGLDGKVSRIQVRRAR